MHQIPEVLEHEEGNQKIGIEAPAQSGAARRHRRGPKPADTEVQKLEPTGSYAVLQNHLETARDHAVLGHLQGLCKGVSQEGDAQQVVTFDSLPLHLPHAEAIEAHGHTELAAPVDETSPRNGLVVGLPRIALGLGWLRLQPTHTEFEDNRRNDPGCGERPQRGEAPLPCDFRRSEPPSFRCTAETRLTASPALATVPRQIGRLVGFSLRPLWRPPRSRERTCEP